MKSWILFLILCTASFGQANSLSHEVYSARVVSADFQDHSVLSFNELYRGSINVNLGNKRMSLSLMLNSDCRSGMFCAAAMKEWRLSLPLRSTYTTSCGIRIFKASTLVGSMSTIYQELLVMDYAAYRCGDKKSDFATRIEFKQIDFSPSIPNSIQQSSTFEAEDLRLTF